MHKPTDIGANRTGIKTSPIDSKRTIQGAAEAAGPLTGLDGAAIEAERIRWSRDAYPVGTVPPPGSLKGVIKSAIEAIEGHKVTVFIDKLGERLAFERTGSRLYDALLAKLEAADIHEGGPTREEIEKIRDDERQHYAIVRAAIEQCGADPTAMTPCADVVAVSSIGWIHALSDPRTTLTQCLDVILSAEATDCEGWTLLAQLADELGFDDLAMQFNEALQVEEEHAATVRTWVLTRLLGESGVEPSPPAA
jgi:rubrerythrin